MRENKRQLIENFFSLSLLQTVNYLLPLVTLPYLVRVLGPEKFGLIAFAQALIQYFIIFTDYGFNLSATRKISIHRDDRNKFSQIFNSVMAIKSGLFICSIIFLSAIVMCIPKFGADRLVYIYTFGMVIGNVLFPSWFFQGMEKMRYITILNILAKAIFTIAIFVFVRKESDYIYVPVYNSLGFITAGILSVIIVWKDFKVIPSIPPVSVIMDELKDGWYLFISTLSITLYTTSNTFILGLFTNNIIVGYYSAAEKIVNIVQGVFMPVSQSVYPYISKLAGESAERALIFLKKIGVILAAGTFTASCLIFIFAGYIIRIAFGSQYLESIVVLRILAFIPFIIGIATIYAKFYLLGFGYFRELTKVILTCGFLGVTFSLLFIHFLSLEGAGAGMAWLSTECCVLLFSYLYYRKLNYARR